MPYKFKIGDKEYSATDIINPPYLPCPRCKKDGFGILMVSGNRIMRRCIECSYPHPDRDESHPHEKLPAIHKKIIYLDQFAISNLMMCINTKSKPYQRGVYAEGQLEYRWVELYRKLDRLRQLQVIICPYSIFHREESLVAPAKTPAMPDDLKRMYELFASGVPFNTPDEIQRKQIHQFAESWLNQNEVDWSKLDAESVTRDSPHEWNINGIIVTLKQRWTPEDVEEQKVVVENAYEGFKDVHERWMKEDFSFEKTAKEEAESYGKSILRVYWKYLSKQYAKAFFPQMAHQIEGESAMHPYVRLVHEIHSGFYDAGLRNAEQEIPDNLKPMLQALGLQEGQFQTDQIHRAIQSAGLPDTRAMQKVADLLISEKLWKEVPYVRIQSLLWATVAEHAKQSGKRPNKGTFTDIEMLSCFLPYCDAMLVDREWCNRLRNKRLQNRIGFDTRVYAPMYINEFIDYLNALEREYSEHIQFTEKVFGAVIPYMTVYDKK